MKCKIKDLEINYEIMGEGKPFLILHGYCVDLNSMTGCMERVPKLRDGYKRIYLDLPGMGETKSVPWVKNTDDMLDVVLAFIDEIIPCENFLVAGYSYGGLLARGLAHKMRARVDGMFLLCPVIEANKKKRILPKFEIVEKDDEFLSTLDEAEVQSFSKMAVVQTKEIYDRLQKEIISGIKKADTPFLDYIAENGYGFSFDVDDAMFDAPTLFLLGKQDDVVGFKEAFAILDNYPRATFAVVDGAGHNLQIEQESVFNELVGEWLGKG